MGKETEKLKTTCTEANASDGASPTSGALLCHSDCKVCESTTPGLSPTRKDAGVTPPPPRPSGSDVAAFCALGCAMLLWSGTFIGLKVALAEYHPFTLIFTRMAASSLMLLPFVSGWRKTVVYTPGDFRIIALLVLSEPCLYFVFEGYALKYTTASQAGMVMAVLPLAVGVGAGIFLKERLPRIAWAGFLLAVAGVTLLSLTGKDTETAPSPLLGNTLEFMAVLMATGYTICVRRLSGYPALCIVALQSWSGVIFFGLLMLFSGVSFPAKATFWPTLSLLYLAAVTIAAYGFYNFGISRLSAARAAAWTNLIPVITLLMGFFLLKESYTTLQYFALVPIIAGVVMSQFARKE